MDMVCCHVVGVSDIIWVYASDRKVSQYGITSSFRIAIFVGRVRSADVCVRWV